MRKQRKTMLRHGQLRSLQYPCRFFNLIKIRIRRTGRLLSEPSDFSSFYVFGVKLCRQRSIGYIIDGTNNAVVRTALFCISFHMPCLTKCEIFFTNET